MSSSGRPDTVAGESIAESDVVAFLRANRGFLDQHPELLSELSIPHASGDAVSLLERQVTVLREENARLRAQFDELVKLARQNEDLNGKIHALALTLMNAAGPQSIFETLDAGLRDNFDADRVACRVFADPAFVDSDDVPQFVGAHAPARAAFAAMLDAAETVCGALADAQREALFGAAPGPASAVVMPLKAASWDGVLVIASDDQARYDAEMGTEFLTYLKDVVALVIDPWVKRPKPA